MASAVEIYPKPTQTLILLAMVSFRNECIANADINYLDAGVALAVDMTARNLQEQVKSKGLPWSAAKGFDTFTPIG